MQLSRALAITVLVMLSGPVARAADSGVPALSVIGTIPGPDGGWDLVSVDVAARRLYIAHGDAVTSVDLDSGALTPKLAEGQGLHAVVPLPNGKLLTTNGRINTAIILEAGSGKAIASVPTGTNPDAAIFDPASGLVLVMNGRSGDITLVDPETATAPGRVEVGGKLELAAVDGKGRAYVNIEDKGEMAVVDIAARKVVTHYKLPGCDEPSGVAIDPKTGLLVVACANQTAIALNAKTGAVAATLAIGKRPDTAMFDRVRKVFYIPCGEGMLSVIAEKGGTPFVVATVPTAVGARTGAVDMKTGRIYLPTADFKPAEGGGRPTVIPGTFRILIVGTK
jgi:DNA-binding beta-propeller fold protein YncE